MPDNKKSKLKIDSKLVRLINLCLEKNIPFVSNRLPFENTLKTWIQLSGRFSLFEGIQETNGKSGFVYAPFHRRTNLPVVFFEPELIISDEQFDESLITGITNKALFYPVRGFENPYSSGEKEYMKQVKQVIRSFDTAFTKTVLSRVHLEKKPKDFNVGKYFINLQNKYPNAFCHLINIPGAGSWLGASPELLIKTDGERVQTVSLAGTQSKNEAGNEIFWRPKEIEEQQYVTNFIIETLNQFGIDDFQTDGPHTLQAGNALHLSTKFFFSNVKVQNRLNDFISSLHPSPAVCGYPREKALELIFLTEKHNREYYAGFCGLLNMEERTELYINLRCMKILDARLALFLGGGITEGSVPELEWKETELKAKTLLSLIEN